MPGCVWPSWWPSDINAAAPGAVRWCSSNHRTTSAWLALPEPLPHPGPSGLGGKDRMPTVNDVGKPCAGEPHARIDGRELETERPDQRTRRRTTSRETGSSPWLRDLPSDNATAPAPDPP